MDLSFATPAGALVGLAGALPLAALAVIERRGRRVRQALGLEAPRRRGALPVAAAIGLAAVLAGTAAAQPLLLSTERQRVRSDAEVFFVIDTSRSMLASSAPASENRFERAQALATGLRDSLRDVPVGIASLTDRILPHLFATPDRAAFATTVERAVGVDKPPPREVRGRATQLAVLADALTWNFFSEGIARRVLVVFTDGEGRANDPIELPTRLLDQPQAYFLFVHVWDEDELVFTRGRAEEQYAADPESPALLERVAQSVGGEMFAESQAGELEAALRERIGSGASESEISVAGRPRALAPFAVAAAFFPLGFLLWRRARA